jgi:hypothetical protein
MELEVTMHRTLRIWWAYLWRNLVALVLAVLLAGMVGMMVGVILDALDLSVQTVNWVNGAIGLGIGLAATVVPLWLILGKNFGEFRLVLLRSGERTDPSS